jgi:hypothetical protein
MTIFRNYLWVFVLTVAIGAAGWLFPSSKPAPANAMEETSPATRPAPVKNLKYGKPRQLASIRDPRLNESSGLAVSWRDPDIFWSHNDSGDAANLYAIDRAGRLRATFKVKGGRPWDWEDMASAVIDGQPMLLIGDIGDNNLNRKSARILVVPEPRIGPNLAESNKISATMDISFTYEDGPQNCEALAYDPQGRKIYLISKSLIPLARVYELPLPQTQPDQPLVAKRVATAVISLATGMDISPDSQRAIVCNYFDAFEYVRQEGQSWAEAFNLPARQFRLPKREQGETICYGQDGQTLYLTSEKIPSPLYEISATSPAR